MFIPSKKIALKVAERYSTPTFLTDANTIKSQAKKLQQAFQQFNIKIFYAIKANYNPHIVKVIKKSGIYGVDTVSPYEVQYALDLGYKPEQIIFTPSNASNEEMRQVGNLEVLQNLGSLSELSRFCKIFPRKEVAIRICPEVGAGDSHHVITGPLESKFGLDLSDLKKAKAICDASAVKIVGIHSHIGSGFSRAYEFRKSVEAVCKVAENFPDIKFLDFGGGFKAKYPPNKKPVDLSKFAKAIKGPLDKFNKRMNRDIEIRIEPGKFLVSESTVLLAKVTTLKEKRGQVFVGLDTGFNHFIRPAMYDSYHHVVNLSRVKGTKSIVQIAGNVCETCDVFNKKIALGDAKEGDIVAILVAGGYGSAMSSNYNMRPFATEVLIKNNKIVLTKRRQTYKDMVRLFK